MTASKDYNLFWELMKLGRKVKFAMNLDLQDGYVRFTKSFTKKELLSFCNESNLEFWYENS